MAQLTDGYLAKVSGSPSGGKQQMVDANAESLYFLVNGTRSMTGNLDLDSNDIQSVGTISIDDAIVLPGESVAAAALDITGATDIGTALLDDDAIILRKDSTGLVRKSALSRVWTYVTGKIQALSAKTAPVAADILTIQDTEASNELKEVTLTNLMKGLPAFTGDSGAGGVKGAVPAPAAGDAAAGKYLDADGSFTVPPDTVYDGDIADLDIDGGTDIGADLADADLIVVDDGAGGTNRKAALSRMKTYIQGIKIDDFTAGDDNTDLDATTSVHGLLPKLGGGTTNFLRADGTWAEPAGGGGGGGFDWTTENEVTTDQSPTTSDLGERYLYTSSTAAARTLTLPSVGESEDGGWLALTNASAYLIYVAASDSDTIGWPLLKITAIEMQPNSHIVLRYDHSNTRWEIVTKSGTGRAYPKGTRCSWLFDGTYTRNGGYIGYPDLMGNNNLKNLVSTTTQSINDNPNDNPFSIGGCLYLDGTAGYVFADDSANFDIFGATAGAATVCGWVYSANVAADRVIITQYEDAANYWRLYHTSGAALGLIYESADTQYIAITGGTLTVNTWHHVAICRVGAETGIYIDGVQVAYDETFTGDTFAGSLFFGTNGASGMYLGGKVDDWAIVNANIFGAAPNVGNTDTITVSTLQPLNLVV